MNPPIVLFIIQCFSFVLSDIGNDETTRHSTEEILSTDKIINTSASNVDSFIDSTKSEYYLTDHEINDKNHTYTIKIDNNDEYNPQILTELQKINVKLFENNSDDFSVQSLEDDNSEELKKKKRLTNNENSSATVLNKTSIVDERTNIYNNNGNALLTSLLNTYIATIISSIYQPLFQVVTSASISTRENNSTEDNKTVILDNKPENHIDLVDNDTSTMSTSELDEIIAKIYRVRTTTSVALRANHHDYDLNTTEIDPVKAKIPQMLETATQNIVERIQTMTTILPGTIGAPDTTDDEVNITAQTTPPVSTDTATKSQILESITTRMNNSKHNIENSVAESHTDRQNQSKSIIRTSDKINSLKPRLPYSSQYSKLDRSLPLTNDNSTEDYVENERDEILKKREISFEPDYGSERQELASYYHNGERIRETYLNSARSTNQNNPQNEFIPDENEYHAEFDPYAGQGLFLPSDEFALNLPMTEDQNPIESNDSVLYLDNIDYSLVANDKKFVSTEKNSLKNVRPLRNRKQSIQRGSKNSKRTINSDTVNPTPKRSKNKQKSTRRSEKNSGKPTINVKKNHKTTSSIQKSRRKLNNGNKGDVIYQNSRKPISTLNLPSKSKNQNRRKNNNSRRNTNNNKNNGHV